MREQIRGTFCSKCAAVFVNTAQLVFDRPMSPTFYSNKKQLEAVLLSRAWSYVHAGRSIFDIQFRSLDIGELNEIATDRALRGSGVNELQWPTWEKHIRAVKRFGGYLQYQQRVADTAWGEGKQSKEVAALLDITPAMVRQILHRLTITASCLGFDVTVLRRESCAVCGHTITNRKISLKSARGGPSSGPTSRGAKKVGSRRWKADENNLDT
jgi:hypothetical protein